MDFSKKKTRYVCAMGFDFLHGCKLMQRIIKHLGAFLERWQLQS